MGVTPIITLTDDRQPWDRQTTETVKQYARFVVFRDLGESRTLRSCLEILNVTGDKIKEEPLYKVCRSYRWFDRAQAYDVHLVSAERARLVKLRSDMINRHRKLALGLIGKAAAEMSAMEAGSMSPSDIVRFITLGADLERKALGEPERIALSGPTGAGPVLIEDMSRYTAEERNARLAAIANELNRRAGKAADDEDDD